MAIVLTNAGMAIIAGRMKGSSDEPVYVGWGTGANVPAVTDTALQTESAETRVAGTSALATTTQTNDTWRLTAALISESSQTITEVGVYDAILGGNMLIRGTHTGTALIVDEGIEYVFDIIFAQTGPSSVSISVSTSSTPSPSVSPSASPSSTPSPSVSPSASVSPSSSVSPSASESATPS